MPGNGVGVDPPPPLPPSATQPSGCAWFSRYPDGHTYGVVVTVGVGVAERVEIPVVNPTGVRAKRPYQEFYTPRARAIVEQVFADRLARYGYAWQPAPPAAVAAPAAAGTPG